MCFACKQFWCVTAFTTAEEFRLEELTLALSKTSLYEPTCLYSGSDNSKGKYRRVVEYGHRVHLTVSVVDFRIRAC